MRSDNKIVVLGNVGQDPELRVGRTGMPWCNLSVATSRRRRSAEGEWEDLTDWHDIRAFGDMAHYCQQQVRKGARVEVEGSLAYDAWTDDDGNKRRSARILATRVRLAEPVHEGAAYAAPAG